MAHNERAGPLPPLQGVGNNIPKMYNRFAKKDPQLYPVRPFALVGRTHLF